MDGDKIEIEVVIRLKDKDNFPLQTIRLSEITSFDVAIEWLDRNRTFPA